MSFKLHYKGGPRDRKTEDSRHAPQTINLEDGREGQAGMYRLTKISGTKAFLAWHPRPENRATG